jgi:hypothetical protein
MSRKLCRRSRSLTPNIQPQLLQHQEMSSKADPGQGTLLHTFNLRDVSKIVQGVLLRPNQIPNKVG